MGPGSGPSMDRVFLKNGGTRTVKQFRHVLVPPAFAQQHAMRMHLAVDETVPEKHFVDKLLNIDRELYYLRPILVRAPTDDIVAGLTDGYSYH